MINFNGQLTEQSYQIENNRGFLYGDSVFESIRIIDGKICFWEDHYFRLISSMRILRIDIPDHFTPDFFEENIENKFSDRKIILDPGIGFGKTLKHNLTLISKISLFHSLGLPIMIGTSRKRFINQISDTYDSKERIGGTMASVLYLLSQGVQIFRVHNVLEIKQGILVFDKILSGK
mgnify:CR=1 FL=1